MKQVTITTGKATIVVVDVPEGVYQIICNDEYIIMPIKGMHAIEIKGNLNHIGSPSQVTEEVWKGIVEDPKVYNVEQENPLKIKSYSRFMDYEAGVRILCTATESGLSLLKSNGVVLENTLGEKPVYGSDLSQDFYQDHLEEVEKWNKAQEQVWSNPQLFIKTQ